GAAIWARPRARMSRSATGWRTSRRASSARSRRRARGRRRADDPRTAPARHAVGRILFYDSARPPPYSSESLLVPGSRIGGAEASVVRVAEELSRRHQVLVAQHNRTRQERSDGREVRWVTKQEGLDVSLKPDAIVVQRKVGDLPLLRR